jgi:hypothetical protein
MKKREMQITIGKDGAVNIEVKGVGGAEYYQEEERTGLNLTVGED